MTLAASNRYVKYTPVVATTVFDVMFPLFSLSDVKVFVDGIETLAFTMSGTFSDGRSVDAKVTLLSPANGVDVEIYGNRPPSRSAVLQGNSPNLASLIGIDADAITATQQEQARDFGRSIRVPVSESGGAELPPAADRAGKFLAFDGLGNFILSLLGPTGAPVSPFMASFLQEVSQSAAQAALGVGSIPIVMLDSVAINMGTGSDVILSYNGGTNTLTEAGQSAAVDRQMLYDLIEIRNRLGTEVLARFIADGAVELYHNGSKKAETDALGLTVTGRLRETDRDAENWTSVARSAGVFYQNTSGRTIQVNVAIASNAASAGGANLTVNNVAAVKDIALVTLEAISNRRAMLSAAVPAGHYYMITVNNGLTIAAAWELI